jgi:hypothetical protein
LLNLPVRADAVHLGLPADRQPEVVAAVAVRNKKDQATELIQKSIAFSFE